MEFSDPIYPGTSALTVLRYRPIAMAVFEKYGLDPWQNPDVSIADLCSRHGFAWSRFDADLEALCVPPKDTDWKAHPIYQLLDFLRQEHREFEHGYLPAIRYAEDLEGRRGTRMALLHSLGRLWPEFRAGLLEHLREEEELLFPRILRHGHALRTGRFDARLQGKSLRPFVAAHLLKNENRLIADLGRLRNTIAAEGNAAAPAPSGHLLPLLSEFHDRLEAHARLEAEDLYPRALENEQKLFGREAAKAADGAQEAAAQPHSESEWKGVAA